MHPIDDEQPFVTREMRSPAQYASDRDESKLPSRADRNESVVFAWAWMLSPKYPNLGKTAGGARGRAINGHEKAPPIAGLLEDPNWDYA